MLKQILEEFRAGKLEMREVLDRLASLPFVQIPDAVVDTHRGIRTGYPEVVYGAGKTRDQLERIAETLLCSGSNVLLTRLTEEKMDALETRFAGHPVCSDRVARIQYIGAPREIEAGRGVVAVVAAGTSDLPIAREAVFTARVLGNPVEQYTDVGVAGVHRLLGIRDQLRRANVLVVVAGMEGALPSVVAGLVSRPVIAVPTSVGYGASFDGLAALLGMLSSCAAGVTVVNIDNGFGAGYAASLINRQ